MIKTLTNLFKQDKEKFVVPKGIQDVIPINAIYDDGIFLVGKDKFAKSFKFTDINYAVASREDKEAMFLEYSELLNSFDNVLAMVAVIIFGSAITAVITIINIVVLLFFMAIVYLGFTVIWLVDRLYLTRKKIFTACHECKEKSLIPTYICPKCGAKHTNLTPGVYGILKRTCNCGEKLPTAFFNGRKNLEAECPNCGHKLTDRESRPICIPIVGGRSVGKTAFITAFSKEFIESIAPSKGFDIEFYNDKKDGR